MGFFRNLFVHWVSLVILVFMLAVFIFLGFARDCAESLIVGAANPSANSVCDPSRPMLSNFSGYVLSWFPSHKTTVLVIAAIVLLISIIHRRTGKDKKTKGLELKEK